MNRQRKLWTVVALAGALGLGACAEKSSDPAADEAAANAALAENAAPAPAPKPVERAPEPPPVCMDCGTITSIEEVKEKGSGSGMGAIAGAVIGGVLGHQVGGGRGKDVATAGGAVAGAAAGHEIEKRARGTVFYRVTVAMDSGGSRTLNLGTNQGLYSGAKVRVVGDDIQLQ